MRRKHRPTATDYVFCCDRGWVVAGSSISRMSKARRWAEVPYVMGQRLCEEAGEARRCDADMSQQRMRGPRSLFARCRHASFGWSALWPRKAAGEDSAWMMLCMTKSPADYMALCPLHNLLDAHDVHPGESLTDFAARFAA